MTNNLISPHGGYKNLKSFQSAEIVFDLTVEFCNRYLDKTYRTNKTYRTRMGEQMEQAARSGKQNIAEGSQTSGTSKQSELRLVDVARASLEELKNDYLDFLRVNKLKLWPKDSVEASEIRNLAYKINRTYRTYMSYMSNAESAANCLICLINQTTYLLDQQMKSLGKELLQRGDFKERYCEARKNELLGLNEPDFDKFLKHQGLRRLENGRVVALEDPATE